MFEQIWPISFSRWTFFIVLPPLAGSERRDQHLVESRGRNVNSHTRSAWNLLESVHGAVFATAAAFFSSSFSSSRRGEIREDSSAR